MEDANRMAADTDGSREGENSGKRKYRLKYYEKSGFFGFLFMNWPRSWMHYLSNEYVEIDELHPLPSADHISYWQPIFSKHVSDALLELEKSEYDRMNHSKGEKQTRGSKHIILRALLKTFWSRLLVLASGYSIMQMTIVGTSLLLKYLVSLMAKPDKALYSITIMIMVIVVVDFITSLFSLHLTFYFDRVHINMESVVTVTLFQHAMSHRRAYATYLEDSPLRGVCKGVVHSWPCKNTDCAQNPLKCPASRHQNKELPSSMYVYLFVDSYAVIRIIDAMVDIIKFLCTFIMSMIIIKNSIGMGVLIPVIIVVSIVLTMIMIEITHGYVWFQTLHSKDIAVMRAAEALRNLNALKIMGMEDVGYNMIQHSRDDEMMVLKTRTGLHSTSIILNSALGVSVLLFVLLDYIKNMKEAMNYSNFDISAPITAMFIVEQITSASANLHRTMKSVVEFVASLTRIERFMTTCSPNYYLKPLEDLKPKYPNDPLKMNEDVEGINEDTLVQFKMASFNWICDRKGLFEAKEEGMSMLDKIDFELKRGEVRIVTGPQGCGKTSFIKSILGEMSLVSGSMAVAPLSTGMPIFYTSQEVWLPTDSIRAIITFGYAFDEEIYNEVVRCAELLRDFSSWDDGDMRVISEKGYSLSGGQRVRVSLARALYAYMVFSKANESLENNRCCFLMCLDEPFNGLDVNVATAIFNNLFNKETGLLVRDDVAIVMAMSMMSVDITLKNVWWNDVLDMSIYTIEGGVLSQRQSLNKNVMEKKCGTHENVENGSLSRRFTSFSGMSSRQFSMVVEPPTRLTTNVSNHDKYGMQQLKVALTEKDNVINTWIGYCVYLKAVGYIMFTIFVLLAMFSNISSNMVLVFLQKWTDNIKMLSENSTISGKGVSECMERHRFYYSWITVLATCALTSAFILAILLLVISMRGARRLHKFALDSIFQKPSSEIPLKSNLSTLMTFITADIYIIGEFIGSDMYETIFAVFYCAAKLLTLCYLFPLAVPITLLVCMLLYVFFHRMYLKCARILQRMMLESNSNINEVYNEVISGSAIYRSFRKEYQWMDDIRHRSDEYYRTKFLKFTGTSWVSLVSKLSMSVMIAVMICISMLRSYIFGTDINVARLGIGMSLCVSIGSSVKTCLNNYSQLERQMCSVVRFENYFLQGRFSLKDRFESMGECILSGFYSHYSGNFVDDKVVRGAIITRRTKEYRNFMFRRYISLLDCIFKRLKIEVIKDSNYFSDTCTSLELKEVSVPVPTGYEVSNKSFILSKISCVGRAGEVIGIVGRTGAGKSTLLNVMQNMVYNRMGSVLLSGTDMSNIPRNVLRHLIGVLPQLPFVLKGWTLRRFLDPRMLFTDDDIYSALDCCGLLDMVHSVTDGKGLNTILALEDVDASRNLFVITPLIPLRSKGRESFDYRLCMSCKTKPKGRDYEALFSPMQMRQLWFARLVLYRHSYKVILLDEPPSNNCAADENNETQGSVADQGLPVYDIVRLYFSHCITFIVAHDKKAITYCNRLWLLENGGLQEDCTIDEFLRRDLMRYTSIRET